MKSLRELYQGRDPIKATRERDSLLDYVIWAAIIFILSLLLGGCAINEWQRGPLEPAKHVQTFYVADPSVQCGKPEGSNWGCEVRQGDTAMLYIKTGLTQQQTACVESHERMHAEGWVHDSRSNALLCGI
jgi:hypothetical protein